jgi:PAS domain S-box-containing protein
MSEFDRSPHPTLVVQLQTRKVVDANPAALRFSGYSKAELLGKSLEDLYPKEALQVILSKCVPYDLARIVSVYRAGGMIPFLKRDGTTELLDLHCSVAANDGDPLLYLQGRWKP